MNTSVAGTVARKCCMQHVVISGVLQVPLQESVACNGWYESAPLQTVASCNAACNGTCNTQAVEINDWDRTPEGRLTVVANSAARPLRDATQCNGGVSGANSLARALRARCSTVGRTPKYYGLVLEEKRNKQEKRRLFLFGVHRMFSWQRLQSSGRRP